MFKVGDRVAYLGDKIADGTGNVVVAGGHTGTVIDVVEIGSERFRVVTRHPTHNIVVDLDDSIPFDMNEMYWKRI